MMCKKSKYGAFFWPLFSRIWTEYGDLRISWICRKLHRANYLLFYVTVKPLRYKKENMHSVKMKINFQEVFLHE